MTPKPQHKHTPDTTPEHRCMTCPPEKPQHTPGPWIAVNDSLVRGPHGEPVASTVGFAWPEDSNHAANAHLIAAAPAMREALDQIANKPIGESDATAQQVLAAIVRIARAALRLADGE